MPYKRIVALRSSNGIGIRQEIEGLTALVAQHAMIERGTLEVRLREDEEEKPKAEIRALIMTSNWEKFLRIQQDIDLLLIDAVMAPDTAIRRRGRGDQRNDNAPADGDCLEKTKA